MKDLLYSHGFTIAGARKRLREGGAEPSAQQQTAPVTVSPAAPRPGEHLRAALGEIRRDIVTLLAELEGASIGVEVAGRAHGANAG